jgi:hypothetical protein
MLGEFLECCVFYQVNVEALKKFVPSIMDTFEEKSKLLKAHLLIRSVDEILNHGPAISFECFRGGMPYIPLQ